MLKAVVFDDEYIVLQGLRTMIDWTSFGIDLVGTASDGNMALSLFRSLRPDIVFTDIRMPGIDGLSLIEEVMREAPETFCIVFSGFNEFEYVKRAINLGVADYLEKPITIQSIEKTIRKVMERVNQQKEMLAIKIKLNTSKRELLEKATLDLLLIGAEVEGKWREIFGEAADRVIGVTVLATATEKFMPSEHCDYDMVSIRHGEERLIVFFHYQHPTFEFWDHQLTESEHAETAVGSGRTYRKISEANQSYREALRALSSARFLGEKGIVRFEDLGDLISRPEGLSEREEAIILSLRFGNKNGLLEQIDSFIQWIQTEKLDAEVAEHEMLKLIYIALEESKKNEGDKQQYTQPESFLPHIQFREMAAKGKMVEWFRNQFEQIADWTMDVNESKKHSSISKARYYMEQNYTCDLTLQEVAEHVGMNPAYFSVLFKGVVGESYIKYLTRNRMELAKSLLGKGQKVNDVSEKVGYHTYRHFSEVFKKYTAMTPGQYKEQLKI
jgi:two-component system response regulator YesN